MSLKPGVYFVRNVKSNTAFEMSTVDNKRIYGHAFHGNSNQQWEFARFGAGWSIKCVHGGRYLGIENKLDEGSLIVAQPDPTIWVVKNEQGRGDDVFRFAWPYTLYAVDLDCGTSSDFTKVILWTELTEAYQQLWSLECVKQLDDDTTSLVDDSDPEDRTTTTTTTTKSRTGTTVTTVTTTTTVTRRSGKAEGCD